MKTRDSFIEAFEVANRLQDAYNNLPVDTKQVFEQNIHVNRKDLGTAIGIVGFICLFSDSPEDRKFGKQALGFGTSLALGGV